MKFRKFLITSSLALALAATPLLIGQESVFADGSVEVWSTYSTLKVMQQKHDYKDGEQSSEEFRVDRKRFKERTRR